MNLAEKYRPKTLDEVRGQDNVISRLKDRDHLNHLLFLGPPGTGKTTVAFILAGMYKIPLEKTNASDERGIAHIRGEIKNLTSQTGKRIILLDEADALTAESMDALRGIMENPNSESIFILTGNRGDNIIEPIKSRCSVYTFNRLEPFDILRNLIAICREEGITIDKDAKVGLVTLVEQQANGDMRKAINLLESLYNKNKKITKKDVIALKKPNLSENALEIAIEGDFEKAKRIIEDAYIENRMSPSDIIKDLFYAIETLDADKKIKIRLYCKLAETEKACRIDTNPVASLVQLIAFIAYTWLTPHFSESCPVLRGDK